MCDSLIVGVLDHYTEAGILDNKDQTRGNDYTQLGNDLFSVEK